MPNPTVSFRLSPYHLARGLKLIRQLEPRFQLMSLSQIVKTIYFDYLAKMTIGKDDQVNMQCINEIQMFITKPVKSASTLNDLINHEKTNEAPQTITYEKADISSVSDFSPPKDWKE